MWQSHIVRRKKGITEIEKEGQGKAFLARQARIYSRAGGNDLRRICGLSETLLWIQLVAEGSSSQRRTLGVAMTKARYNFVEGSPF